MVYSEDSEDSPFPPFRNKIGDVAPFVIKEGSFNLPVLRSLSIRWWATLP